MKLISFSGVDLNGYLGINLKFDDTLTFLTGINGTGKTTALNSIAALLMPRLDYLASQEYSELSLTIEHNGEKVVFKAFQEFGEIVLTCSKFPDENISYSRYDAQDEDIPHYKAREREDAYYNSILQDNTHRGIIGYLQELPTPMFLGLDRRTRTFDPDGYIALRHARRRPSRRNIFGNSLSVSLTEALAFAAEHQSRNRRRKFVLDRKFRDNLVLELLSMPPAGIRAYREESASLNWRDLQAAKKNIYKIPELLGLPREEVISRIGDFFEFIEGRLQAARSEVSKRNDEGILGDPSWEARVDLAQNKSNIDKINKLSSMVSEYTSESERIDSSITDFLDLANSFLRDSGKELEFDESGELVFSAGDGQSREITALSSGEIQIIVILAHLYFNPETKRANVFIIDEPELSLHVQWQQKFVESLLKASGSTQFLMATHSPTVIIGRVKKCIDLSPKK